MSLTVTADLSNESVSNLIIITLIYAAIQVADRDVQFLPYVSFERDSQNFRAARVSFTYVQA